jgi:eukaryotic translation initiation factor 2C
MGKQNGIVKFLEDFSRKLDIMVAHLEFYKQKNGALPGKIMYYRDGVSEGQFLKVLEVEMSAIHAAMKSVYGSNSQPAKVTFIVVQKRHHTRFFPTQKEFR